MIPDQTTGISDRCIVKFQAAQDLSCQFLTCRAVSLEVVSAVPVRLFHDWFRNVVKKHCDAEKPVILNLCKTFQNMLAHSIAVVWVFCSVSMQASNSGRNSLVSPVSHAVRR